MSLPLLLRLLVLCVPLSLVGCGGGGGGGGTSTPPADETLLTGDYFLWAFAGIAGATDQGSAAWAVTALDGMGALSGLTGGNTGGSISGPSALAATYTVAADRAVAFQFPGADTYAGWTDTTGSVSLAGSTVATMVPATIGLVKLGSGFVDADLAGDWFFAAYSVDDLGDAKSYWGSATLNALGTGSGMLDGNEEGVIVATGAIGLMASVASNGQVALDVDGLSLEGALDASRTLIVATGATAAMTPPIWVVMVRKTAGASNATFTGTYQIVGLERDGAGFASITGSGVANGAGSLTATFSKNTDGVLSSSGPDVVGYSAAADGGLTIDPVGEPILGGFSAGGSFAVVAGPATSGSNPRMYVLMRR